MISYSAMLTAENDDELRNERDDEERRQSVVITF